MSLKAFHVLFIALSIALSAGVGGWAIQRYLSGGGGGDLALGIVFFAGGLALIVYGGRFFRKLKELG